MDAKEDNCVIYFQYLEKMQLEKRPKKKKNGKDLVFCFLKNRIHE